MAQATEKGVVRLFALSVVGSIQLASPTRPPDSSHYLYLGIMSQVHKIISYDLSHRIKASWLVDVAVNVAVVNLSHRVGPPLPRT